MDNDLSKCKVGDWIATLFGWEQIEDIDSIDDGYPIRINGRPYTREGFFYLVHKAPSAFVEPPEWLLEYIGPKPCPFKKDELVMIKSRIDIEERLRYFAYYKDGKYYAYNDGRTSVTAKRKTVAWKYCRKAIKGEDY